MPLIICGPPLPKSKLSINFSLYYECIFKFLMYNFKKIKIECVGHVIVIVIIILVSYHMQKKSKIKSVDRKNEERGNSQQVLNHQRKCQTPSMYQKKKQKSKQKSTNKKSNYNSIKQLKPAEANNFDYHAVAPKKDSPFKHKNRPISNLANARMAKNIDHQLSHLNQSVFRNEISYMDESQKRVRYESAVTKQLEEGKKHMKNNHFEKALKLFQECVKKQSDNIEALYLLGVSAFHLEDYEQSIKSLTAVLLKQDHYRKNVYLFLAISYKKINNVDQALIILTKAISYYPKYYDAYVLRAKILSKQKRYYDAIQDLNKCIKIQPQNLQAYVSKADCLRSLAQYKQSIILYSQVLSANMDLETLLKRAIAFIQNGDIAEALQDLNNLISTSSNNSEAFLFKGLAYSKINNYNDAILSYEQAIKYNSSKKATTKALYEIAKLKIDQGDYYGASYTLERANSLEIDMKVIEKMKLFTEGSTSIMKRKLKRGVENLSILCRKQNLSDQLRPLVFSFRAYGYFCQHKFSNAINDLKSLTKLGYKLDRACQYNYSLLEGIIAAQNNQFQEAIISFKQAALGHKEFSDPDIYCGLARICEYNRNPKNKNPALLEDALRYISHALQKEENSNTYYLSASILFELGEIDDALINVEKAMQKSEDHVMKHLYLRALIMGLKGQTKEALKGFHNVLKIYEEIKERQKQQHDPDEPEKDKQIPETYLNRAKCYLINSQKKKAFQDLQTYIAKKPLDSEVHSVAGKLLFSIGSFQDAVKAYNYSPNIQKHRQVLLERLKCYLLLKQLNCCLRDMEKLAELGCKQIKFDCCCLDSLKQASKGTQQSYEEAFKKISKVQTLKIENGIIFKQADMYFYKGFFKFQLKQYTEALKLFTTSRNLKTLNNELEVLDINQDGDVDEDQLDNRIYTDKEIQYNIAVTQFLMGKDVSAVLGKYCGFADYYEGKIQESKELVDCTPFPTANRLCSIFPETTYEKKIKFKLSFCLPEVLPPEIKFEIDPKIIRQINMCSTQPRPDAPWIKRNVHGVIFTDEVMGFDVDLKTQKSVNNFEPIKIETQFNEEEQQPNERERIKQMLSLDHNLQSKLQKLMKKKQAAKKDKK